MGERLALLHLRRSVKVRVLNGQKCIFTILCRNWATRSMQHPSSSVARLFGLKLASTKMVGSPRYLLWVTPRYMLIFPRNFQAVGVKDEVSIRASGFIVECVATVSSKLDHGLYSPLS